MPQTSESLSASHITVSYSVAVCVGGSFTLHISFIFLYSFTSFSLTTHRKAARRKKQAEAEKLPEVSKDIFYDVAVDLKEVFGSTTTTVEGEKDVFEWDKEEEEVQAEEMKEQSPRADAHTDVQSDVFSSAAPEKTESSGFKFSFFGEEEEIVTDTNAMTGT